MTRALVRGYPVTGKKRAGQVTRIHIIRDRAVPLPDDREQTWCGQSAGAHKNSAPLILDPVPARAPDGLRWCPACIGHLAEVYGLLDAVAESLAAYDPGLYVDLESRWERRRAGMMRGTIGASDVVQQHDQSRAGRGCDQGARAGIASGIALCLLRTVRGVENRDSPPSPRIPARSAASH